MANIPDRDGRFKAFPMEWAVEESGDSKLATFVCKFSCVSWYLDVPQDGSEPGWYDSPYGEITGYFYLEKKDGSLNDRAIQSIRDSLGWDGRDLSTLANGDWSQTQVQITCAYDTYQGKTRLKVQWLNPADWEGGGIQIVNDPAITKNLSGRLNGKLRALSGPASSAPRPAGGKPSVPPRPGQTDNIPI